MANQWFKFYGAEYLSDPKMDRLTVQERSCWLTLLCMASQSDGIIKFLSVEGLLNKSGVFFNAYDSTEWDNAKNVLHNFETYEMIKVDKNGVLEVLNWEKRQEQFSTNAERQAKYRENKKSNESVTPVTTKVTLEENRIDKNRKRESSLSFLKEISKEEMQEFTLKFKCEDANVRTKANALYDYCKAKGRVYKNYKSFLSNALRKDFGERPPKEKVPNWVVENGVAVMKGYK